MDYGYKDENIAIDTWGEKALLSLFRKILCLPLESPRLDPWRLLWTFGVAVPLTISNPYFNSL
jgi:hypothetical protein